MFGHRPGISAKDNELFLLQHDMRNWDMATSSTKAVSLAVLPFDNLLEAGDFDYFARELQEELIVDLSHFPALQVISSYTSNLLSTGDGGELETARKIRVDYLLKGSLQLRKEAVRLNAQLLDTVTGEVIWANRLEGSGEAIFEILDSIVEQVVFSISAEVDHTLLSVARNKPLTSLEAYDCWLRGMDRLRLGTLEADREAREFFNQALSLDPNYSRAYAGLSLSHFNEWSCQLWDLYEDSEKNAYDYAAKAYQLDENDHIVQMILGRVYLYRRQFDQAEYHIEKSLDLNVNDADNLVQLASCMAFLGRGAEGERLFKKALRLNPYRNLWYYQYGSLTYFVMRQFKTSIEMALKRQLTNVWVDLPGYIAAAYAYLGDADNAQKYIILFRDWFSKSITKGKQPTVREVIDWVKLANPYRYEEDIACVIDGLLKAGLETVSQGTNTSSPALPKMDIQSPAIFRKEQEIWHFVFDGHETTMVELKGFHDISRLIATPDCEVHCTELMGSQASMDENDFALDAKARKAYEQHIHDLKAEISEADNNNDLGRKRKLQQELEEIIEHLSKNLGLGKRRRKLHSPAERARAAVTLRIRNAIKKITGGHPALGRHLSNSIRTGVFCCYTPEEQKNWVLR